jgi:hypothetical protein
MRERHPPPPPPPYPHLTIGDQQADYAPELFYSREGEGGLPGLRAKFDRMRELFVRYAKDSKDQRDGADPVSLNFHRISDLAWLLFLGEIPHRSTVTFETIDDIVRGLEGDGLRRERCLRMKSGTKRLLMAANGERPACVFVGQTAWIVKADVDLPWMVPVDMHWFNPTAVPPDTATLSEMQQMGRLTKANPYLYRNNPHLKHLLRLLLHLERHVTYSPDQYHSMFLDWNRNDLYTWYKPQHQVVMAHNRSLQWCMFLAVPAALVEANLTRILIPRYSFIAYFAGEVRPRNLFDQDLYAAQYLQVAKQREKEGGGDKEESNPKTHLVVTLTRDDRRPGVGNPAFFSNGACYKSERWFKLYPNALTGYSYDAENEEVVKGRTGGSALYKAEELYRQSTLSASVDITGRMIKERHAQLFPEGQRDLWVTDKIRLNRPGGGPTEEQMLIPVEWCYDEIGSRKEKSDGQKCQCMSRCYRLPAENQSVVDFIQSVRARPRVPPVDWDAIMRDPSLDPPVITCIGRYLQQWEPYKGITVRDEKTLRRKRQEEGFMRASEGGGSVEGDDERELEGWVAAAGSSGAGCRAMR